MKLTEAINYIFDENCILFLGSGASLTAKNIRGENLKSGGSLANHLFELCGLESDNNLTNATEEYLDQFGEYNLISLLKELYTIRSIQEEHRILGSLNWKRIYTTNYDNALELAYNENGKVLTPVTLSNRPSHFKDKRHISIHINGYIGDLTPETLKDEFKLSEISYLTNDFKDSDWGSLFRQDLVTSDAIFFVGFSLNYDLDLKRIIYSTPELKEKCFFILAENESAPIVRNCMKFGNPETIGLSNFSNRIVELKKSYKPKAKVLQRLLCFKSPVLYDTPPDLKDKDFFNLLIEGNINEHLLQYSIYSPDVYPYFILRSKTTQVVDIIKNGEKNILILSDLGNGKTMFIKGLTYILRNEGYNIFDYYKYYATLEREIEHICTKVDKSIIIVENYNHYLDVLTSIKNLRSDSILIATERNLVNDLVSYRYEENIIGDYKIIDLNILNDEEINTLIELLDRYGHWGKYASFSATRKYELIVDKCKRNIRLLLLMLLESPTIIERFKIVISSLQDKKNFYEAITLILASKVFGFQLDLEDLIYALDNELLNKPSFQSNPVVREFVDFTQGKIVVKSSILSEAILANTQSSKGIVDTFIKVCKRLDNRREDKNVKIILKELISFSNLQRILQKDTSEFKFNILRFFEEIRNMNYCTRNPHFWLQYAIARLSEREYPLADSYFSTAYSYANDIEYFDTYQIDNHYARHVLENEIYNGTKQTCMIQFLKAHKILSNPHDRNRTRHYPFRVALNYYPFYEKFFKEIPRQDQIIFLQSCDEILNRIDVYKRFVEQYRIHPSVKKCSELLSQIVAENN